MKKFICFLCLFILLLPNNSSHAQLVEKTKDDQYVINLNTEPTSKEYIEPTKKTKKTEKTEKPIELSCTYLVMYVGTSFDLKLRNVPHNASIKYEIDSSSILYSKKGITVNGVQEGISVCKAIYEDQEYLCTIVVKDASKILDYSEIPSYKITEAIYDLYDSYPEGMRWDDTCRYMWSPNDVKVTSNSDHYIYDGGGACASLCMLFSDLVFPNQPIYYFDDINNIQIGDILCVDGGRHMVMVVEMNETQISVVEGNYNKSIHWRRILNKADMGFKFGYSRLHQ